MGVWTEMTSLLSWAGVGHALAPVTSCHLTAVLGRVALSLFSRQEEPRGGEEPRAGLVDGRWPGWGPHASAPPSTRICEDHRTGILENLLSQPIAVVQAQMCS